MLFLFLYFFFVRWGFSFSIPIIISYPYLTSTPLSMLQYGYFRHSIFVCFLSLSYSNYYCYEWSNELQCLSWLFRLAVSQSLLSSTDYYLSFFLFLTKTPWALAQTIVLFTFMLIFFYCFSLFLTHKGSLTCSSCLWGWQQLTPG